MSGLWDFIFGSPIDVSQSEGMKQQLDARDIQGCITTAEELYDYVRFQYGQPMMISQDFFNKKQKFAEDLDKAKIGDTIDLALPPKFILNNVIDVEFEVVEVKLLENK